MVARKRKLTRGRRVRAEGCFDVEILYSDAKGFGRIEGWSAKELPLREECRHALSEVRKKKEVTVITVNAEKGRYIIHCPHPPCW